MNSEDMITMREHLALNRKNSNSDRKKLFSTQFSFERMKQYSRKSDGLSFYFRDSGTLLILDCEVHSAR